MANAPAAPKARQRSDSLPFAFLVYREGGTDVWTARSVLTGHLGHGSSAEEAVSALQTVIDVSIAVAAEHGQPPPEWLRRQRPGANEHAVEFCRLMLDGVAEEKRSAVARAGCTLEIRVAKRVA
jgi:predicted RNase H-like HicB family nuclease